MIPRVPVRQWVLSFPIPLRILFAAHPELLTPVLRIIHRVIARFLLKQAGLKRTAADTGAVTLIQRFDSAANLNIHLHCLVLDGVYRRTEGEPAFQAARASTRAELESLLAKIIARLMKMLTRLGYLVEEQGMTYMADIDGRFHGVLAPNAGLRAAIVPGPPQNTGDAARTGAAAVSVPGGVIRKTRAVLQRGRRSGAARVRAQRSKCVGVKRFGLM